MKANVQGELTLEVVKELLQKKATVTLDASAIQGVKDSFSFLKSFSKDKLIYGINTGLGPMAQYRISEEQSIPLQYNLIRSHCSGAGNYLEPLYVKAMMIARLNSFMLGHSGVHEDLPMLIRDLINLEIYPCIPEHGGVGASGDLVQLAHLALVLIGEGEVNYKGSIRPTADVVTFSSLTRYMGRALSPISFSRSSEMDKPAASFLTMKP